MRKFLKNIEASYFLEERKRVVYKEDKAFLIDIQFNLKREKRRYCFI